ncbi:hypothetical protein Bbelb_300880 [Branchiostoma belcheri]|nr:hypothetical protein Bbelb_300880 [Branchiostoma belcheri]
MRKAESRSQTPRRTGYRLARYSEEGIETATGGDLYIMRSLSTCLNFKFTPNMKTCSLCQYNATKQNTGLFVWYTGTTSHPIFIQLVPVLGKNLAKLTTTFLPEDSSRTSQVNAVVAQAFDEILPSQIERLEEQSRRLPLFCKVLASSSVERPGTLLHSGQPGFSAYSHNRHKESTPQFGSEDRFLVSSGYQPFARAWAS